MWQSLIGWCKTYVLHPILIEFRVCLFLRKMVSKCKIFLGENIFRKGKYFQVFGGILKNILKNIFQCLVMFLKIPQKTHFLLVTHIFSASKQIYNIICQQRNTKETKPKKKKKSSNPVNLREEGRERGDWVRQRGDWGRSRGEIARQR